MTTKKRAGLLIEKDEDIQVIIKNLKEIYDYLGWKRNWKLTESTFKAVYELPLDIDSEMVIFSDDSSEIFGDASEWLHSEYAIYCLDEIAYDLGLDFRNTNNKKGNKIMGSAAIKKVKEMGELGAKVEFGRKANDKLVDGVKKGIKQVAGPIKGSVINGYLDKFIAPVRFITVWAINILVTHIYSLPMVEKGKSQKLDEAVVLIQKGSEMMLMAASTEGMREIDPIKYLEKGLVRLAQFFKSTGLVGASDSSEKEEITD